jgi:uncharacterized membrane protein YkvA (DUF1232 family)
MRINPWKDKTKRFKREIHAVYFAVKDPRTPWYARVLAAIIVSYAFSPIDLIPDAIPILGLLDDLVILPLGIILLVKIIPSEVLLECRAKADVSAAIKKPKNWVAGSIIIAIWVGIIVVTGWYFLKAIK